MLLEKLGTCGRTGVGKSRDADRFALLPEGPDSEQLFSCPVSPISKRTIPQKHLFCFSEDAKLQVLNFTGYQLWEMAFTDGTVEYSNHAK